MRLRSTSPSTRKSHWVPASAGFRKLTREARADVRGFEVADLLDPGAVVAWREKSGSFDPEPLGPAEQVAVFVIRTARGAVERGITSRGADKVARAVGHVDEDGKIAVRIETVSFPNAYRADGRDRGDRLARVSSAFGV